MNSIFEKTLRGEKTERPPVWFMRQAGRVLPSYLKLREKYDFHTMMRTPELAAEVTLLPYHDLGIDALVLFNDILTVPEALGMELVFTDHGPVFANPISSHLESYKSLTFNPEKLQHVYGAIDAINAMKRKDLPLLGFCGAPLTIFCYMVQALSSKATFPDAMKLFYEHPKVADKILTRITDVSVEYAVTQVKHGINAFQLFESHASLLPLDIYQTRIMPHVRRILNAVKAAGCKTIYFPKGFGLGFAELPADIADFVSVDWQFSLPTVRKLVSQNIGLQGNLDPRLLLADQATIKKELEKLVPFGRENDNWIFNLGHGLIPQIPVENVKFVVDWVKNTDWS